MTVPNSPQAANSSEGICRRSLGKAGPAEPSPASDQEKVASTSTTYTFLPSSTCILDSYVHQLNKITFKRWPPTARVIATVHGQESIV
eukprot:5406543-Pleurochrysis_carterae.AAC.1